MARNILAVRVPMIAAINGDAIGIGATISLFCDVVYMADDARIADPHVRGGDRRPATAVPCSGRSSWARTGPRSTS